LGLLAVVAVVAVPLTGFDEPGLERSPLLLRALFGSSGSRRTAQFQKRLLFVGATNRAVDEGAPSRHC